MMPPLAVSSPSARLGRLQVAARGSACQEGATEGQGTISEDGTPTGSPLPLLAQIGGNPTARLLARPTVQFEPFLAGLLIRKGSLVYSVFDGRELVATYDGEDLVVEPTHKGMGIEDTLPKLWAMEQGNPEGYEDEAELPGQWRHAVPEPWPDAGINPETAPGDQGSANDDQSPGGEYMEPAWNHNTPTDGAPLWLGEEVGGAADDDLWQYTSPYDGVSAGPDWVWPLDPGAAPGADEFMEGPDAYEGEAPWATSLAGAGDGGWLEQEDARARREAHHRHAPPKYHTSGGKWRDKKQCNGCGNWFAGGGYHSHTRGGCGSQAVGEAKEKRFVAVCLTCYSQRLETDSKREAERWCTSHEGAYGHGCSLIDRRKQEGLTEEHHGDPFGRSEIGTLDIEDTELGPQMSVTGVQVRQSPEELPGTQYWVGEWTPPWEEHGVVPSKFLPNQPILWIDIGEINPYRGRNPRVRKSSPDKPAGPYQALVIDPYGNLEDGYHRYYDDFVDSGYTGPVPVQVLEAERPAQCETCGVRTVALQPFDVAQGSNEGTVSWVCSSCSGMPSADGFSRIVAETMHQLSPEEMEPPTACEFYRNGFCSITGGVCPHYAATFRRCEIREYALANRERVRQALPDEDGSEDE